MKEDSPKVSKVYYGFTPHVDPYSEEHIIYRFPCSRGSIAMVKDDDKIHYGFTICSTNDNFSRSLGRKQAHERLALGLINPDTPGYNYYHIPPLLQKKFGENEHELCLYMLNSIVDGLTAKIGKTQRKLGEARKKYETKYQRLLNSEPKAWDLRTTSSRGDEDLSRE